MTRRNIAHWRIYCDGREFGVDYRTLEEAQAVKTWYASYWTHHHYYIRRHNGPVVADWPVAR